VCRQQEDIEDKNNKNQKIIYHLESEDSVSERERSRRKEREREATDQ
jgi:hypothetical protein